MHFRMHPSPEVEEEIDKLLDTWVKLPENDPTDPKDYILSHCSNAVKEYYRECAEIQAQLEPGEHV